MGNSKCRFFVSVESFNKEVSGSRNLVVVRFPDGSKTKILIDCGLNQESKYVNSNDTLPFNAKDIDYVIVTHNHVDHTGMIPLLVKNGYYGDIITSKDTSILMPATLRDTCRILSSNAKLKKLRNNSKLETKFKFKAKSKDRPNTKFKFKVKVKEKSATSPYDLGDVEETLALLKVYPFEQTINLNENIKLTLFKNAHLPGAAIVLLQFSYNNHDEPVHYEDINLLFTGDYNNVNPFLDAKPLPDEVLNLHIHIIQESTYGNSLSSEVEHVFESNILKAVSEKREILLPVLALGRYQEILFHLKKLQDDGKLDKNIPIYCDGNLGIYFTKLFHSGVLELNENGKNFLPQNVHYISNQIQREELLHTDGCKIILTTSGMGNHGPARVYLPAFLRRKNALIHFTCYLAENTLGRTLLEAQKKNAENEDAENENIVEVYGMKIKIEAEIKFTFEFSAHAKKDELISFLNDFNDIKTVLINHGSFKAKDAYSTAVLNETNVKNVCILGNGYYFRLNAYGLVGSYLTHSEFS